MDEKGKKQQKSVEKSKKIVMKKVTGSRALWKIILSLLLNIHIFLLTYLISIKFKVVQKWSKEINLEELFFQVTCF